MNKQVRLRIYTKDQTIKVIIHRLKKEQKFKNQTLSIQATQIVMQKIQKNKDPFMYQIQFKQVKNFKSWPFVYIPLIVLSAALYGVKLYQLIHPGRNTLEEVPFFTIFIVEIFFLATVIIVGGVSLCVGSVNNIFAYLLILAESLGTIFVQTTLQCFQQSQWCQSDVQYQAGAIILLCLYAVIVYFRSSLYYPFYDNFIYISMSSSSIVLFDFAYKLLLGLITNLQAMESIQTQRKFMILITIGLYCVYNGSNYYCNPKINICWIVVNTFLAWTTLVIYLLPYLDVISTMTGGYVTNTETLFYYVWGYSTPCLICYIVIANFSIDTKDGWKQLFLQEKHQIKNLDHLYLMASQLKQKLKIVKNSQQKTNDLLFKSIWALVQKHNTFCDHVECPLNELKNMQIHRNDDFLQSKRLGKTIQCCYSFGQYHLQRKKDRFPNLLQLSVQIANYELQVFQNRQKGLVLHMQFYTKENIDSNEKFMLYYLKKKIEELFIENENYSKTNTENQISEFRHNIEVSVSMLAEFWYFLADPKCNLKKLYDLANVLFPLKIGVDNEWKNIQKLKNIQSYNLYARYLIKVFNDKEKGFKILQEAKKIQLQMKNKEEIQIDAQGNNNVGVEQNGIIFLQFDGKNPGVMYQVNLAAQRIFGYNKGQLVNRKVNDIMPRLFANHHDKILENYQQTNKTKMMNKERVVWGKSKDGYMFTFSILIKPVKNLLSESSEVYACIKRETWVKESAFLTLDMQDQISEVSATMLGIYPELYGKVNLKRKMNISQIIPNFAQLKTKMLQNNESTQELQIHRQYDLNDKQKFKQTTIFYISLHEINIEVAGKVGYFLKFQKTAISNGQKDLALSNIRESRLKQNNFRFIYQILQGENDDVSRDGEEKKAIIKFKGGIVHDIDEMARSCVNSASKFFTKLPVEEVKKIEQRQKIDYGQNIKTKRLQGKQIREIHLISQESQFDIGQVEKQMQQNLGVGNIKPSQLSSILQKQTSNKHIFCLKLITFCILIVSSILCIIEYINLWQQHAVLININEKVRKLYELGSEIMYMKMYTTQFSSTLKTTEELALFTNEINLLDEYLDYYPYNTQTKLVYNDGSQQTLLLGFALNKLISQANSMKSSSSIYNQASSHVHFVNYNTINGLILATRAQNALAMSNYNQSVDRIESIENIYIGVAVGLFVAGMVLKNLLLRIVLKKKSQILEVFFEIPRKACTSIQKECERFIQRLSSENQQQLQSLSMASQGSQAGFAEQKKQHNQKKRTVMGQQKTTNHYIIATVAFIVILLFYHIFVLVYYETQKQELIFTMSASQMIFKLQKQASVLVNLMNSYALNQSIPLLQRNLTDSFKVIQEEFNQFNDLYADLAVKFYLIGNILDETYLANYNMLTYQNLCTKVGKSDTICNTYFGQNYGLNVVVSQYFNLIKDKYLEIKNFHNTNTFNFTAQQQILKLQRLRNQRSVQYLLKQHWRQLTSATRDGLTRKIRHNDTVTFALMLTMCIANCTVLLFCWLRFYHNLEQKIAATEYILTFIPIDEINRNPKIANYIREGILQKS